jgi:hypothetical protein
MLPVTEMRAARRVKLLMDGDTIPRRMGKIKSARLASGTLRPSTGRARGHRRIPRWGDFHDFTSTLRRRSGNIRVPPSLEPNGGTPAPVPPPETVAEVVRTACRPGPADSGPISSVYPDAGMIGKLAPAYGLWTRHVRNLTLRRVEFIPTAPDPRPMIETMDTTKLCP